MRQYAGPGLDNIAWIPMTFGSYGEIIILKLNQVFVLPMGPDSACNERIYDCWDFCDFWAEGFEGEFAIVCGRCARRL